jgi:hypothetical protein
MLLVEWVSGAGDHRRLAMNSSAGWCLRPQPEGAGGAQLAMVMSSLEDTGQPGPVGMRPTGAWVMALGGRGGIFDVQDQPPRR